MSFVHLAVHTEYSLADSTVRIKPLMAAVAARGMPAVAVTDPGNLFAMVKAYRAAQEAGVKPIIGADVGMLREDGGTPDRINLLCAEQLGYANLTRLITRSFVEGQVRGSPTLQAAWLDGAEDGLIALSGGRRGEVGRNLLAGRRDLALAAAQRYRSRFGDRYYLEVQRTGRESDERLVHETVRLAAELDIPIVATNDVRFLDPSDHPALEMRVCIAEGTTLTDPRRDRSNSDQQYLRAPAEMEALFVDLPEALQNSVEIARRCTLELRLGENFLPEFPVPEGILPAAHLRHEAEAGLAVRASAIFGDQAERHAEWPMYRDRLTLELDVIEQMGFPGYFLIVADFIRWARDNGVPVGPGRGSGAGSLVAYALRITDLDPIRYELLFERFLNPERVSMPDFDVDFCMEGRDRVIDYVAERYGREKVSQIITYGSMAARAVVRDVGRVLGHPYGFCDRVAKLIPFEVGTTLDKALKQDGEFQRAYESEEDIRALVDAARELEGLARNAGRHAGGVVIAPSALTDFTPLYCEQGSTASVTQLDKDDVESVGLVKFDFLGLRTLTIIDWAVATVNRRFIAEDEPQLDITRIPLDDSATFALLKRCQTTAVFQLESRGMKDLIKRLKPDSFEEIIALVALFRPGPLQSGMVEDFIARKHGQAAIHYPHPSLEPILKPTYGVILYQEQVMKIAQTLAGYTLGAADLLRRAMGKKKAEEMAEQRDVFVTGAVARGVQKQTATAIFDLIEKFAGYGFNKSHSAAYALLSYQTAWLKAHYPAAFMAAVLSADMDHTDKVVPLVDECEQLGLSVDPPHVDRSDYRFTARDAESISYGLGAVKGIGEFAVDSVVEARASGGPFTDLRDLCSRLDMARVNRRALEALLKAGAADGLGPNRASLLHGLPRALQEAEQATRAAAAGQDDMFGLAGADRAAAEAPPLELPEVPDLSEAERLAGEKETLGLYLSGHPIESVREEIRQFTSGSLADLAGMGPGTGAGRGRDRGIEVVAAGLVVDLRRRAGRVTLVLDDRSGRLEVTLFEEVFEQHRNVVAKDRILVIEGRLAFDEYLDACRMTVKRVLDMERARDEYARRLLLDWDPAAADDGFVHRLQTGLEPFLGGHCEVWIRYLGPQAVAPVRLDQAWRVHPRDELLADLRNLVGEGRVRISYRDASAST
jgi:DNA polymerase III subunit alpha